MVSAKLGIGCSPREIGRAQLWRASGWMLVGRFALQNLRGGTAAIRRARVAQCCTNCGCVIDPKPGRHGPMNPFWFAFTLFAAFLLKARRALRLARYGLWRRFQAVTSLHFGAFLRPRPASRAHHTRWWCTCRALRTSRWTLCCRSCCARSPQACTQHLLGALHWAQLFRLRKHERRRSPDGTPRRPRERQLPAETTELLSRKARVQGARRRTERRNGT